MLTARAVVGGICMYVTAWNALYTWCVYAIYVQLAAGLHYHICLDSRFGGSCCVQGIHKV